MSWRNKELCSAILLALSVSLATLSSSAFAKPDDVEVRDVNLDQLAPTQADVGMAEINEKYQEYIDQAKKLASTPAFKNRTFNDALVEVLNSESRVSVQALVDPDGRIRVTDGHHKVMAVKKALAEFKIPETAIKWRVRIADRDIFHDWEKLGKRMEELHIGRLNHVDMEKYKNLTAGERAQKLEKDFNHMGDSPMRSAIGRVFETLDLKGTKFKADAQFEFGDAMRNLGVKVVSGEEFNMGVQGELLEQLLNGPHKKELQDLLIKTSLPESVGELKSTLANATRRFNRAKVDLEKGDLQEAFPKFEGVTKKKLFSAKVACVMQSLSRLVKENILPKAVQFPQEAASMKQLFKDAQSQVLKTTDLGRTSDLLGKIADGNIKALSRPDLKYLKYVRKAALKLRNAYRFFGADGSAPSNLEDFGRNLGQLNDDISKWNDNRLKSKDLKAEAKELKKLLDGNPDVFKGDFKPGNIKSMTAQQREGVDEIKQMLAKNKAKELTVEDYHLIRRRIRSFSAAFEVMARKGGGTSMDLVGSMLDALSHDMGKVKDQLTISRAAAQLAKPGKALTQIDDDSLKLLNNFVQMMENSLK